MVFMIVKVLLLLGFWILGSLISCKSVDFWKQIHHLTWVRAVFDFLIDLIMEQTLQGLLDLASYCGGIVHFLFFGRV